jgi:hypothetical protein
MTQRTVHWLDCDYGHCAATYDQDRQREHNRTTGRKATLRQAAINEGWSHDNGRDLCIFHTETVKGQGQQPALFAVPDPDTQV